jgi:hypothetical protein
MGKADISSKFTLGESFAGTSGRVPWRETTTNVANSPKSSKSFHVSMEENASSPRIKKSSAPG